uniref:Uncharacterized protein n=1 Tax=Octopus bimaculoides TaxID=37653 RepID=A0A0L8HQY2_OCTBM
MYMYMHTHTHTHTHTFKETSCKSINQLLKLESSSKQTDNETTESNELNFKWKPSQVSKLSEKIS